MFPDQTKIQSKAQALTRRQLGIAALLTAGIGGLAGCQSAAVTAPPSGPPRTTPTGAPRQPSTPTPTPTGTPTPSTPPVKPVQTLDGITVTGDRLKQPTTKFKTPWAIDKPRSKVLIPGDGPVVDKLGQIEMWYAGYNGRDANMFDSNYESRAPGQPPEVAAFGLGGGIIPGVAAGLIGKRVGDRVLLATDSNNGYGPQGQPQAQIRGGDSLIFVVDIVSTTLEGPEGAEKPLPSDFGLTVTTEKNVPAIVIPKGAAAPRAVKSHTLITGTGRKVAADDQVQTKYVGVEWASGKTVFNTYAQPAQPARVTETIPGLAQALIGQTVGSRVVVMVPAAQAYPNGNATPAIAKGASLAFVVDILFTTKAPPAQQAPG